MILNDFDLFPPDESTQVVWMLILHFFLVDIH